MSVQFKIRETVQEDRRREIIAAVERAGFAARNLFPNQKRPRLASIFTVSEANAKDLKALRWALSAYGTDIEFVETAPTRGLKA